MWGVFLVSESAEGCVCGGFTWFLRALKAVFVGVYQVSESTNGCVCGEFTWFLKALKAVFVESLPGF